MRSFSRTTPSAIHIWPSCTLSDRGGGRHRRGGGKWGARGELGGGEGRMESKRRSERFHFDAPAAVPFLCLGDWMKLGPEVQGRALDRGNGNSLGLPSTTLPSPWAAASAGHNPCMRSSLQGLPRGLPRGLASSRGAPWLEAGAAGAPVGAGERWWICRRALNRKTSACGRVKPWAGTALGGPKGDLSECESLCRLPFA